MSTPHRNWLAAGVLALGISACTEETGVLEPSLRPSLSSSYSTVLSDDFEGATLDLAKWLVRTSIPQGSASVSQSGGSVTMANRGHLVTQAQFNPQAGALKMSGRFAFTGAGDDFFQFVWRTQGQPGGPWGETTDGISAVLFTQHVGEAPNLMTMGGVTLTSDVGSLQIVTGEDYTFVITDDGTNVSFSVTRVSNGQTRTQKGTTSYVGTQNRIAIHNRELCCAGHHRLALRELVVESVPPAAPPSNVTITSPAMLLEGAAALFTGSATDNDGGGVTFNWLFGDGGLGAGASVSHTYADNGTYTVALTAGGGPAGNTVVSKMVTVQNVAPEASPIAGDEILVGESYAASGTFKDPGADSWTASVDWGDASGGPLALSGKTFSLAHVFKAAGTFTVKVTVSDDDGGTGITSASVKVLSPAQGTTSLSKKIGEMQQDGLIPPSSATSFNTSLNAARESLERGNTTAAAGQMGAFDNQVRAAENSRRITPATANTLTDYSGRIVRSFKDKDN